MSTQLLLQLAPRPQRPSEWMRRQHVTTRMSRTVPPPGPHLAAARFHRAMHGTSAEDNGLACAAALRDSDRWHPRSLPTRYRKGHVWGSWATSSRHSTTLAARWLKEVRNACRSTGGLAHRAASMDAVLTRFRVIPQSRPCSREARLRRNCHVAYIICDPSPALSG